MKNPLILCLLILLITHVDAQVGIGTVSPTSTLDIRGSVSAAYRSFTTSTSASSTDYTLVFTGTTASTLTLPDATACTGRGYQVKNASATLPVPLVTISTTSSQTIDGATSWLLDQANESVLLVSNGTNWNVSAQNASAGLGTMWAQGGNNVTSMQAVGTTSNFSLPVITNNVERMRVDSMGNVAIGGITTSGAANAEKLLIKAGTTTSPNLISATGSINSYLQLNIQNTAGSALSSTDLITTNDVNSYVDLGINSSGYSTTSSPLLAGVGNAYLYTTGNDFIIGDSTIGKNLIFFTGGAALTNERMRVDGNGNLGISTTAPNSTLDVNGSTGRAITTVSTNVTLDATYNTVIITGGTPTITLPAAASANARRVYTIVNQTGSIRAISSYKNLSGTATITIAAGTSIAIQSDGTNWYRIQ